MHFRRLWSLCAILVFLAVSSVLVVPVSAGEARPSDFEIVLPQGAATKLSSVTLVRWTGDSAEAAPFERLEQSDGSLVVRVAGGCLADSTYVLHSLEIISSCIPLDEEDCGGKARISPTLFRRAELQATLREGSNADLPTAGELVVQRCPKRPGQLGKIVARYPIQIDSESGKIEAAVPALSCADLTVVLDEFPPVAWLGVRGLEGPDRVTLPPQSLKTGASVLALVTNSEDDLPCDGCRVMVVSETDFDRAWTVAFGGSSADLSWPAATTDRRGWARVAGIEPGPVRVLVVCDHLENLAPRISPRFEVSVGAEKLVEATLKPFGGLEVTADTDLLAAVSYPVSVRLAPVIEGDPRYALARRKKVDPEEPPMLDHLPPGTWRVSVETEVRDGGPQRLGELDSEVVPGVTSTVHVPLTADVVRGRVMRGDQGVAARLQFVSRTPDSPGRYLAESDDEGDFLAFLSTPGLYTVKATARELGIDATVPEVEMTGDDPVEIELPDGRISGTVVDEDGNPREAAVVATCLDEAGSRAAVFDSKTSAATDGAFELVGLPQGTWRVHALAGDLRSSEASVELAPDGEVSGLQLVVKDWRTVRGRVLLGGLPAAYARVIAFVLPGRGRAPSVRGPSATGMDGAFELSVDDGELGAEANIGVFPPRGAAWATRRPIEDQILLDGPETGGAVEFRFPAGCWTSADPQGLVLVSPSSGVLSFSLLVSYAGARFSEGGLSLSITSLAPGAWSLVFADLPGQSAQVLYAPLTLPTLASFQVRPGSVTEVDLTNHPLLVPKNEPDDAD